MNVEVREDDEYRSHVDRPLLGTSGRRAGGQVVDTTVIEVPVERAVIQTGDRIVLPPTARSSRVRAWRGSADPRSRTWW
ncbi:hypothetical protein [Streptomyces sp. LN325]|uniref:hypothetical protein n=1 Tax=Streptomyces sp. LN325 TaxID=3112976 RepID=UPI0037225AD6